MDYHLGLQDARLQQVFRDWQAACGIARMPMPTAFEPREDGADAANIVIVDVAGTVPGRQHFRFRYVGPRITAFVGANLAGRWVEDFPGPAFRDFLKESYRTVATGGMPLRDCRAVFMDGKPHDYEALLLPVGQGGTVSGIVVALVPLEVRRPSDEPSA